MIKTFRSKVLRNFFEKGDATQLPPDQVPRIRVMLARLDSASTIKDMNAPGYDLHKLSGDLKDFLSIKVKKNFKIWFKFENGDAYEVDYGDYH